MTKTPPLASLRGRPSREPAARADDVRRHNLALVVQQVAARGTVSRAELARMTRLTKGTISTHVQELLRLGLLVELGTQADGRVGRPHSVLALNGNRHCGIGIEINVDYVAVCVADLLNQVRFHRVEAVDNRGIEPARVLDRAARLVLTALEAASAEALAPAGIAVAVPGTVEVDRGRLLIAPNLGWSDLPIVEELVARLGPLDIPVVADNEANLAALGELWLGIGAESGDYVHVSGEIGVGAGIVVRGALFRGSRGFAGEIGHVVVDPGGPTCPCGGRGCLERVAGQDAILRGAGLPSTTATTLGRSGNPLRDLVERLEHGNARALAAVQDAAAALGLGLAGVVNMIDPDTIILGGTYSSLVPWLRDPLKEALARQVIASQWRPLEVRPSALGPDAAVRGAASWIIQRVLAEPATVSGGPGQDAAASGRLR
ncbi:MAG: ROK family protein [Gaiellaceae bacterium]